jgi:WD repeat-containing protein 48
LGQQRCIATIYCHTEGVWALQTDDAFTHVFSSGRDRNVWATDLRQVDRRALVCRESAPVLRMILTPDNKGLWTSTTESSVRWWNIGGLDYHSFNAADQHPAAAAAAAAVAKTPDTAKPEVKIPEFVIPGGPSIKQCEILNDKRHILTKDTDNNVALYDVLKARKVEDLHQVDFDAEVKNRFQVSVHVSIFLGEFFWENIRYWKDIISYLYIPKSAKKDISYHILGIYYPNFRGFKVLYILYPFF